MNTPARLLLAAAGLAASALVAQARIERVVEKNFTVSAAGTLQIETHGGSIRVVPGNDTAVRVIARQIIDASTDAEADELLKKATLTIEQSGANIHATSSYEKRMTLTRGNWPPVRVDFEVTVPASFATDLSTSGGGINVGNLAGKAKLRTSGGNIDVGKMGNDVEARTSGGNISLAEAAGRVELKTSGGNVKAGRVTGAADLSTSGGNITIEGVGGALHAQTSGGDVRATITGPLREACSLSTSGGSVRVTVDRSAAFALDASTSGGSVSVEGVTVASEKSNRERNRLAGTVNGGGPQLKLRSSGGGISVRAN